MSEVVLTGIGRCEIREGGITKPANGEVLVAPIAVTLCGTDRQVYLGKRPDAPFPRIPGHEIVGRVLGNQPLYNHAGAFVVIDPYTHCGKCSACLAVRYNCCENNKTMGAQRDGGLRETISVPPEKLYLLPDDGDHDIYALVEPLSLALHILDRAGNVGYKKCLIVGFGNVGELVLRMLVRQHAKVVVLDHHQERVKRAVELGAELGIPVQTGTDLIYAPAGYDIAFETAGSPFALETCIKSVAFGGKVVVVGHNTATASISNSDIVFKELTILGSRNSDVRKHFPVAIEMLHNEPDIAHDMITHRFKFYDTPSAFDLLVSGKPHGKIMITF
jgi:2-desacetyl-2-hydroxyethyl bacteriochlorophyllide A dehydrogenase